MLHSEELLSHKGLEIINFSVQVMTPITSNNNNLVCGFYTISNIIKMNIKVIVFFSFLFASLSESFHLMISLFLQVLVAIVYTDSQNYFLSYWKQSDIKYFFAWLSYLLPRKIFIFLYHFKVLFLLDFMRNLETQNNIIIMRNSH